MNCNLKYKIPEKELQYADFTLRLPVAVRGFVGEEIYKTGPCAQQSSPSHAGALLQERTVNCRRTEALVQENDDKMVGNEGLLKSGNRITSKHADEMPGKPDRTDKMICTLKAKVRKSNDSLTPRIKHSELGGLQFFVTCGDNGSRVIRTQPGNRYVSYA